MERFQITLARPQGYLHTEGLREVAETLQFGLRGVGHVANIAENVADSDATNIFLGAHLLSPAQANEIPPGSVIYNLEQLGGPSLPESYCALASRCEVWDYSRQNIERWKQMKGSYQSLYVPIGYVPEMTRITRAREQDIDVLFYGSLNARRKHILNSLRHAGVNVQTLFGVYGRERDKMIARSKVVLNINFYDTRVLEIVRISYLLSNSKAVVSEYCQSVDCPDWLLRATLSASYDSLLEACLSLLSDPQDRQRLEDRGFQLFSQHKETDILGDLLEKRGQKKMTSTGVASAPAVPRKLNLGSGKDWREDYLNVDVEPYWMPDAVVDLNKPFPFKTDVHTERFGDIRFEHESFDEIMANDSLEHIPNLTLAMSSCLSLLKVGGVFRISVPYDLSWGAWQDPTHVRAFNERSWLYYTDWFWYMGWTEARFDLVKFDLDLSPFGQQLARQNVKGEDLARFPRAIDQMRVVLQKRLLTDSEKLQVQTYLARPERRNRVETGCASSC